MHVVSSMDILLNERRGWSLCGFLLRSSAFTWLACSYIPSFPLGKKRTSFQYSENETACRLLESDWNSLFSIMKYKTLKTEMLLGQQYQKLA
jgi:hypothetical protein